MLGKVSKAAPSPKVAKPKGSQTPSAAIFKLLTEDEAFCGANAEVLATRAARIAMENLAMVILDVAVKDTR
jgi:hypothetical protein